MPALIHKPEQLEEKIPGVRSSGAKGNRDH
jgi:hypothetical protein